MKKGEIPDIQSVKKINTLNIAEDIQVWLAADSSRTREQFVALAGISLRTLESVLGYNGEGDEPNWRRSTLEGIMRALECETYYTPKHEIK